jgi:hypothetical protein
MVHSSELSGKYQLRLLVAKQGETLQEMSFNFADELSVLYSAGILFDSVFILS